MRPGEEGRGFFPGFVLHPQPADLVFHLFRAGAFHGTLRDVPTLGPTISRLDRGEPAPPPFDDVYDAMDALGDVPKTPWRTSPLRVDDEEGPVQQWRAIAAVAATARRDSLEAAIDAVTMSAITHGREGYRQFLARLYETFPALSA